MHHINLYNSFCKSLENTRKYRNLPDTKYCMKKIIDFSNNDYLALSKSASLLEAANHAGLLFGVGSTGSRLLSGNNILFEEFEKQIAIDKKTEEALIFNSGYQANLSVLASLCDVKILKQQALVFFDKLNHASLYQAIFLSGAKLVRYQHNNMEDLNNLLELYKEDLRPKFIVTETVFGMDGDIVDLSELVFLAHKYETFLYLDEAHATGILGVDGYGLSGTQNLSNIHHLIMGTFSKGVGVCGAYAACSRDIKNYLINRCPGFIYSTSLSPMIIGAAQAGWKMIKTLDKERRQLLDNSKMLREKLSLMGFNIGSSMTNIIPIILGSEETVLEMQQELLRAGIIVSAIRPPTVPQGSSRIRIALNLSHNSEEINQFIKVIENL